MKVLLIRPPATHIPGASKPAVDMPLGLMYIAALLLDNGHEVEIYDALLDTSKPEKIRADGTVHVGIDWDSIESDLKLKSPAVTGISGMFTTQRDNTLKMAQLAKQVIGSPVIIGGSDPSANFLDILIASKAVDVVCRGEGEYTMLAIANALRDGHDLTSIAGTAARMADGSVRENELRQPIADLDALPFPAYDKVAFEQYVTLNSRGYAGRPSLLYPGSERAVSLITSRGCPFNCVFCSIHLHMGKKWRAHSPEYVIRHIEFLVKQYAVRHIHFEDDNLTLDTARCAAISAGMELLKPSITWDTPNGVRIDRLTRELLASFKKSGCVYIILAIESGVQSTLNDIIDKRLDLQGVPRIARWCNEIGIDAMSFFVIGFPGETPKTMRETINFALQLWQYHGISPSIFIATPLIGTRLYTQCVERGYLTAAPSSSQLAVATGMGGKQVLIETADFKTKDINAAMRHFIRGYKRIFLQNLIRYIFLRPPARVLAYIRAAWRLRTSMPFKEVLLHILLFRNSVADKA